VTLLLADEIDISRGDMIVTPAALPQARSSLRAELCWLSETPLDPNRRYSVRHTTSETKARLEHIESRLNLDNLRREETSVLALNDIARVSLRLARPVFADTYAENRVTGAFIVVDETANNTVGAGIIL
jgi:sulfate adenylyltransferase subunit 1